MSYMETIFIRDKSLSELLALFVCEIENDDDFYDVIAYNISQISPEYLTMHIHEYSGSRLRAAVLGIGWSPKKEEKQRDLLLSLLEHSEPLIIARAADALRHSGYNDLWPSIEPLLRNESPYVIGAALRYARFALPPENALTVLKEALANPDSIVRQNALDELGDLGDKQALDFIRPYCEDSAPDVKQAANTAYETIVDVSNEHKSST